MFLKINLILIISCAILLQSCSFSSKTRSMSPHFNGQLTFNSKPIVDAKIMLSAVPNDKFCLKAKQFSSTNKQGQFNLNALTEQYTYLPFASQQLDEWNVCVIFQNNTYRLYSNNRYGSGNVMGSVFLQCDLALNPVDKPCTTSH